MSTHISVSSFPLFSGSYQIQYTQLWKFNNAMTSKPSFFSRGGEESEADLYSTMICIARNHMHDAIGSTQCQRILRSARYAMHNKALNRHS